MWPINSTPIIFFLFIFNIEFTYAIIDYRLFSEEKKSADNLKIHQQVVRKIHPKYLLSVETYTLKDGLINNRIRSIMQDKKGFLWIGTSEGLSIFDGKNFKNYGRTNGFPFGTIPAIYESKYSSGDIWISSAGDGIIKFKNEKTVAYSISTGDSDNIAFCFFEDDQKRLWAGTRYGLYYFKNNKFERVNQGSEFESVKNIFPFNDSLMILVSDFDCYIFNKKTFNSTILPLNINVPEEFTTKAIMDDAGEIWIGIVDGSFFHIKHLEVKARYKIGDGYTYPGLFDEDGNIWIGDVKGLLKANKNNKFREALLFNKDNGLPPESYVTFLKDSEGNIWLGNHSEGLVKIKNRNLYRFELDDAVKSLNDSKGNIWIITRFELIEIGFDTNGSWFFHIHVNLDESSGIRFTNLTIDMKDNLIINYSNNEIKKFKILHKYFSFSELQADKNFIMRDFLYSIYIDKTNRFWCAKQGEIFSFRDRPENNPYTISLPNKSSVHSICQNKDGSIIFSTFDNGLFEAKYSISEEKYIIEEIPELRKISVGALFLTRKGNLFAGSNGNGLFLIQKNRILNISSKDGLPSNFVWDISEGGDGKIWIATSNGMCYLENEASGKIIKDQLTFGNWIFNCGTYPDGIVWGLTKGGLLIYEHMKETNNNFRPQIYITNVSVNGRKINYTEENDFTADENNCEIEFVLVSFDEKQTFRYQYSISEDAVNWSPPTASNRIFFAALKPGRYNFMVRAVSESNLFSNNVASWTFVILPPLWQRWWFILLFTIVIIIIAYLIIKSRINRIRQIEKLRTQIASDLHDDLASNLSSITLFSKIIQDRPEETQNLIGRIINISKESVNSIRDIIWAIDSKPESINDLLLRLHDNCLTICRSGNIRLSFKSDQESAYPSKNLTPGQRKNIWLVLKEAFNNTIKHSNASELTIESYYKNGKLTVIIKDNGKGFDLNKNYHGKGLETMKVRANELGGDLIIISEANCGTEIKFSIKI